MSAQTASGWSTTNAANDYPPLSDQHQLTYSTLDYRSVDIAPDSVIYCDIPYVGTQQYGTTKQGEFDLASFTQWAKQQSSPVYVSSYDLPEQDYECIEQFNHRSTLSATANNQVTERLYLVIK